MSCAKKHLDKNLMLYAVTDRRWLKGRTLAFQVEEALKGGVTFVQLRDKELDKEAFLKEALELRALCRSYGVPFVINDRVDAALEADADGVHVGQKDMEAGCVRELLGSDKILGVSVRTVEQALLAERQGADYLGVGAVFPTGTKTDARPLSRETLEEICRAVEIPVVAIGGISRENVMELAGSGICGTAVVSAVFAQRNIRQAAQELLGLIREMLATPAGERMQP